MKLQNGPSSQGSPIQVHQCHASRVRCHVAAHYWFKNTHGAL